MNSNIPTETYVAFLRGINVGGHHKVPMADLRMVIEELGFKNVITLLNSGNVIFDTTLSKSENLEELIAENLEKVFGFQIPTIVRSSKTINQLFKDAPFQNIEMTKDIRLYVSFLKNNIQSDLKLPWISADNSYEILAQKDKAILSVLNLSISQTPQAMEILEKSFGKDITTRNWKTIERITNKL